MTHIWYTGTLHYVNGLVVTVTGPEREEVERYMATLDHEGASEWDVTMHTEH